MIKQVLLLECLINMWDANDWEFHVDPHISSVEVEDTYFLTRLSKREAWIVLVGHQGIDLSMDEYMARYYIVGDHKSSGKIPIKDVVSCPLYMILFTIGKLESSASPHLYSKA